VVSSWRSTNQLTNFMTHYISWRTDIYNSAHLVQKSLAFINPDERSMFSWKSIIVPYNKRLQTNSGLHPIILQCSLMTTEYIITCKFYLMCWYKVALHRPFSVNLILLSSLRSLTPYMMLYDVNVSNVVSLDPEYRISGQFGKTMAHDPWYLLCRQSHW
jgi:hypothetical protein